MNLRQERMKYNMTVSELSQATKLEASVIRDYEYNNTQISGNHLKRFNMVFKDKNVFYGLTANAVNWNLEE